MKSITMRILTLSAMLAAVALTGCGDMTKRVAAKEQSKAPEASPAANSLQAASVSIGKIDERLDVIQTNTEALRNELSPKLDNIDRNVADVLDAVGRIERQLGPGTDDVPQRVEPAKAAPVPTPIDAPPNDQADRHTAAATGSTATLQFDGQSVTIDEFLAEHFKGRIWSHPGRTIDDELARHGVGGDIIALDVKVKEKLHSAIHEREAARLRTAAQAPAVATVREKTVVRGPVQNCPGGKCPAPQVWGTYQAPTTPREARKAARGR